MRRQVAFCLLQCTRCADCGVIQNSVALENATLDACLDDALEALDIFLVADSDTNVAYFLSDSIDPFVSMLPLLNVVQCAVQIPTAV